MGQPWDNDELDADIPRRAIPAAIRVGEGDRIAGWLKRRARDLPTRERLALEEAAAALIRGEHRSEEARS